ncbi:ergothioneine biosynthesis protein EgtB [Dyella sp.]|uniref:ergothioneine biosynthesis protein EgtB n=1 Tax=Dyella sp. TaxID=1869338 RepID=UPI002ED42DD1
MTTASIQAAPSLAEHFARVRGSSIALSAGLSAEDMQIQSMPDASPGKWNLAHTTWFFEQFVLAREHDYRPYNADWHYLFNSYYQSVGPMHARPHRGLLSRPSLAEVLDYRRYVDDAVQDILASDINEEMASIVTLGLQHEQQHQELLLTDILHALYSNPLKPAYSTGSDTPATASVPMNFVNGHEGLVQVGHDAEGFAFDNESPRHRVWLAPHALANRAVTNAEYAAFIHDGGYREPTLWLSEGWATVQREQWQRPLYWQRDLVSAFTLHGVRTLDPHAPVCHLSYFEADAFARWAGARLPTEAEWESAAVALPVTGNLLRDAPCMPRAAQGEGLQQMYGDVWEWTSSAYGSYPGFKTLPGALGEYNGKFMSGQMVLRGGSLATPYDHIRPTYRNFFPPDARWQFMGVRLAQDR